MLFENFYANDSGNRWEHLKTTTTRCDLRPSPLAKNRMEALFPALSPSRAELRQIARLIEDAVNALVTDVNVVAYDELIDDYHPSSMSKAKHEAAGNTIPVGYWFANHTQAVWKCSSEPLQLHIRSAPASCLVRHRLCIAPFAW
jgi:hypothetical protein